MRILIGGSASGCGKTTVSMIIMAALGIKGLSVAPYKVGPDYIDTGFHAAVCGRVSHNLDTWLMKRSTIKRLLTNDCDISVIEGVMGYYDGLSPYNTSCSTCELATITKTPALLTVDASGGAASVAAIVKGFKTLKRNNMLRGVLINRASSDRHYKIIEEAVKYYTGLPCLGYIAKNTELSLPSRHLGLVPANETEGLIERVQAAAENALDTLNLDGIIEIAATAPKLDASKPIKLPNMRGYRLGVALDDAFHFYYPSNLDALAASGMELVYFSPLNDEALPDSLDGLYIGGGYPEVFSHRLSQNVTMRESIKRALENGLRCYAECGGLMYLGQEIDSEPMVGFLPCVSRMTRRLQRFGYATVRDDTGLSFPAHEFHHSITEALDGARLCYHVAKASDSTKSWDCGYTKNNTLAAYAHVHFADKPELIKRFFD